MKQGSSWMSPHVSQWRLPLILYFFVAAVHLSLATYSFSFVLVFLISRWLLNSLHDVEFLEKMSSLNNIPTFTMKAGLVYPLSPLFSNVYYSTCRELWECLKGHPNVIITMRIWWLKSWWFVFPNLFELIWRDLKVLEFHSAAFNIFFPGFIYQQFSFYVSVGRSC